MGGQSGRKECVRRNGREAGRADVQLRGIRVSRKWGDKGVEVSRELLQWRVVGEKRKREKRERNTK